MLALAAGAPLEAADTETEQAPLEPRVVEDVTPSVVEEVSPTVVGFEDYYDPLEPLNRRIFVFNDVVYRHALIPLANGYVNTVPPPVKNGISRLYANLREPLNAANHLLQGDLGSAGGNVLRFAVNSTVGLLGLFDPAENWLGIEARRTTLNQTLGGYRIGNGAYLVLPLLGPSDVRNGISTVTESLAHPIRYIAEDPQAMVYQGFGNFQEFAPSAATYQDLRAETADPYLYFRNQYLQGVRRDQEFSDE